jgi:formylglycine-generating enzyme required for sulfatase activity
VVNIAPVGTATLGAGLWGQLDLAGDAWEWNLDSFDSPEYGACTDCAYFGPFGPSGVNGQRVIRGGNFFYDASLLSVSLTPPPDGYEIQPGRENDIGFRCARAP